MDLAQYRKNMRQLESHQKLARASVEMVKTVCPHIGDDAIAQLVERSKTTLTPIAAPGLRMKDSFVLVVLWAPSEYNVLHRFGHESGERLKDNIFDARNFCSREVAFVDEAIAYAQANWGDTLVDDTWKALKRYVIMDPKQLVDAPSLYGGLCRRPLPLLEIGVALNEDEDDDDAEGEPLARVDRLDASIVYLTDLAVELDVMVGSHHYPPSDSLYCVHCGTDLDINGCRPCDLSFDDDKEAAGGFGPMPLKVIEFAEAHGIKFGVDPRIQIEKARTRFRETGY